MFTYIITKIKQYALPSEEKVNAVMEKLNSYQKVMYAEVLHNYLFGFDFLSKTDFGEKYNLTGKELKLQYGIYSQPVDARQNDAKSKGLLKTTGATLYSKSGCTRFDVSDKGIAYAYINIKHNIKAYTVAFERYEAKRLEREEKATEKAIAKQNKKTEKRPDAKARAKKQHHDAMEEVKISNKTRRPKRQTPRRTNKTRK